MVHVYGVERHSRGMADCGILTYEWEGIPDGSVLIPMSRCLWVGGYSRGVAVSEYQCLD